MPANRDLVAAARAGDKEAFGALYAAIYTDLYKFAYYLLKNEEDAKDAVSDAVMDAYAGISKLRSEEAFKAWTRPRAATRPWKTQKTWRSAGRKNHWS